MEVPVVGRRSSAPSAASRCTGAPPTARRCASARRPCAAVSRWSSSPRAPANPGPIVQPLFEGAAFVAARAGRPDRPRRHRRQRVGDAQGDNGASARSRWRWSWGPPLAAPARRSGSRVSRRAVAETSDACCDQAAGALRRGADPRPALRGLTGDRAGRSRSRGQRVRPASATAAERRGRRAAGPRRRWDRRRGARPATAAAAARWRTASRSSRGSGKYSSSSTAGPPRRPRRGARRSTTACDQLLGRRRPGGDADRPGRSSGSSSAPLTRSTRGQPAAGRGALERQGVRGVGRADDDDGVALAGDGLEGGLAVGGGEAQVAAGRAPTGRGSGAWAASSTPCHSSTARVVWARKATGPVRARAAPPLGLVLDAGARRRGRPPPCRPPRHGPRGRRTRSV